jgi:FeS assembly SUF system protein
MDDTPRQRLPLSLNDDKPSPPPAPTIPPPESGASLEERVIAALRTCFDPEIPVNIYELGLIYDLQVDSAGAVSIRMTLTSPACPVAGALPADVQSKVQAVPGVTSAKVELVWDPPWEMSRMSEEARLQLGLFD